MYCFTFWLSQQSKYRRQNTKDDNAVNWIQSIYLFKVMFVVEDSRADERREEARIFECYFFFFLLEKHPVVFWSSSALELSSVLDPEPENPLERCLCRGPPMVTLILLLPFWPETEEDFLELGGERWLSI